MFTQRYALNTKGVCVVLINNQQFLFSERLPQSSMFTWRCLRFSEPRTLSLSESTWKCVRSRNLDQRSTDQDLMTKNKTQLGAKHSAVLCSTSLFNRSFLKPAAHFKTLVFFGKPRPNEFSADTLVLYSMQCQTSGVYACLCFLRNHVVWFLQPQQTQFLQDRYGLLEGWWASGTTHYRSFDLMGSLSGELG